MSCSPARLAANRQNALKSSGPKSAEGKASSRLNAFQHGMAGQGDLLGPDEDQTLVAERSFAFARELKAEGEMGLHLARRAALLSVRMDRLARQDLLNVAVKTAEGVGQFDLGLAEEVDGLVDALQGDDPIASKVVLESLPDGLARLIPAWLDLRDRIEAPGPGSKVACDRALRWLGLSDDANRSFSDRAVIHRIDAEVARLKRLADSDLMAEQVEDFAKARVQAGILASLDTSPEAILARRYEAAAERGFYQAIRAIRELNKSNGRDQELRPSTDPTTPFHPQVTRESAPVPITPTPPEPPRTSAPLGSFRAEAPAPELISFEALEVTPKPFPATPEARKNRPDLKKVARKLAHSRR